jgi:hypothetical protein
MVSVLILVGAISFMLVAAYQWVRILGVFGGAPVELTARDWLGCAWNVALAAILWLVWFYV